MIFGKAINTSLISKKDSSEPKERRKHSKKLESDSSSSSSDSDEKKKKAKKAKKKSEKKEKKDKKIHKSDKDKKKKHHKKHHKKHKKKEKKYGKYGIITYAIIFKFKSKKVVRMTEMPSKREEYMHWLREVKNINIDEISHPQEKKLFEEYVEDYNTCSFKSKKYYHLREWEARQENKKHQGKFVQTNVDPMSLIKNDEENLK